MCSFNILCIDGGGQRGTLPISILKEIQEKTGLPINQLFDLICGTSTGGLIAAWLSMETVHPVPSFTLQALEAAYSKNGKMIFPARKGWKRLFYLCWNLFRPKYQSRALGQIVKKMFDGKTLLDARVATMIPTYDLQNNQPLFFKTREAKQDPSKNLSWYDVCMATSAAPTYFAAHGFHFQSEWITCIDGGVYINNPSMAAIAEVMKHSRLGFYKTLDGEKVNLSNLCVLSLGTGDYEGNIAPDKKANWGALQWITRITDLMMKGVNKTTHYEVEQLLPSAQYLRINIAIQDMAYAELDNASSQARKELQRYYQKQVLSNPEKKEKLEHLLSKMLAGRIQER